MNEQNEIKEIPSLEEFAVLTEKYFYLDESPIYQNKFIIRMNHDKFLFPNGTNGSYGVFIARLLNLTYPEYLRYARDRLGAELIGKNRKYIVPYFDDTKEVNLFIKLLNKRMKLIMFEHTHPYDIIKGEDGNLIKVPFKINENNS